MGRGQFSFLREKGDTKLNNSKKIDVTPKGLIVVVCFRGEGSHGPCDYPWELGVLPALSVYVVTRRKNKEFAYLDWTHHANVGIFLNQTSQYLHLLSEITPPYISYPALKMVFCA